jgi:HD-GYP domain-containing protein (c-di-GMP phosphodiesterase class II)
MAARILCVADVFDALTAQRPYRGPYSFRDAMQLMQGDSGRHFDPNILARFFKLVVRGQSAQEPIPSFSLLAPKERLRTSRPNALPS